MKKFWYVRPYGHSEVKFGPCVDEAVEDSSKVGEEAEQLISEGWKYLEHYQMVRSSCRNK